MKLVILVQLLKCLKCHLILNLPLKVRAVRQVLYAAHPPEHPLPVWRTQAASGESRDETGPGAGAET